MAVEKLSKSAEIAFGFAYKITSESGIEGATWMSDDAFISGDKFYVSMNERSISLCITDNAGNSAWVRLENNDKCYSGLEASILIKRFHAYLKRAHSGNKKIAMYPNFSFNGRKITSMWINLKDQ